MTTLGSSSSFIGVTFFRNSSYISITPDVPETHEIADEFLYEITEGEYSSSHIQKHPPKMEFFSDVKSLRENAFSKPYSHIMSIVFKDTQNYSDYSLYMNGYYLPSEDGTTSIYSSTFGFLSNSSKFDTSGYSTTQLILDQIIMRRTLRSISNDTISSEMSNDDQQSELPFFIKFTRKLMPGSGETVTSANLGSVLGFFLAVYEAIATIPLFAAFLINLVTEKTAKTREYLFMMGLKKPVYWFSWFITFFIPVLLFVVCALVLNYSIGAFKGYAVILFYLLFIYF